MSYALARPVRRRRRHYANHPAPMRRRRHHNPFGLPGRELVGISLWAIGGGVLTRALPQMFLKDSNTGWMGYIANGVTAGILGFVGDRFVSPTAGKGLLIGGIVMTAGRMISDLFGKTLVSFGDLFGTTGTSGLGAHGDPSFDLGLYTPGEFVVPTWSEGTMQKQDYPFWSSGSAAAVAPAAQLSTVAVMKRAPAPAAGGAAPAGTSGLGMDTTYRLRSRFAA